MNTKLLQLLKKYGFKWYKDQCTDTVDAECIEDILPAANGFTVVYKGFCAIRYSTVVVEKIEIPNDFKTTWIFVHWRSIEDERFTSAPIETIPSQHEPKVA